MNFIRLILFVLILTEVVLAGNPFLKPVMTIGDDERDDYMFFNIKDAVMSSSGDIYVADAKGAFISKYDKNGNFVKRVGRYGKGPGDFLLPKNLRIFQNKLYILDSLNERIAYSDLNLLNFKYYRTILIEDDSVDFGGKIVNTFHPLDKDRFLCSIARKKKGDDLFFIVNQSLKVEKSFFNHVPKNFDRADVRYSYVEWSNIVYDISDKHQLLMVAHKIANNPIDFHIFDLKGGLKQKFQYSMPNDIKDAGEFFFSPRDTKKRFNVFLISSIHAYRDYFLVNIEQTRNLAGNRSDNKHKTEMFFLVYDMEGKLIKKIVLDTLGKVFSISENGYLLRLLISEDEDKSPRLAVYKLTL